VWHILDDGEFELVLVNAAHVKNVPGRKTDVNLRRPPGPCADADQPMSHKTADMLVVELLSRTCGIGDSASAVRWAIATFMMCDATRDRGL
jgi:hypothetical protein